LTFSGFYFSSLFTPLWSVIVTVGSDKGSDVAWHGGSILS